MILIIALLVILVWSLWKFMNQIRNRKRMMSLAYLIVILGFGSILVSIFYPGGFEGMAIAFFGLLVGLLGLIWVLVYTIITKLKKNARKGDK